MKKLMTLLSLFFFLVGCQGQEKEKVEDKKSASITEKPKGSWKVNREFDEHGNLIRYDSIYSYSSSDYIDDLAEMDRDSIFRSFQSRFSRSFSSSPGFPSDFFGRDSLFMDRFFADDFFESEMGQDFMDLNEIHKRMEEMHRQFFKRYQSDLKEPEKEEEIKI